MDFNHLGTHKITVNGQLNISALVYCHLNDINTQGGFFFSHFPFYINFAYLDVHFQKHSSFSCTSLTQMSRHVE